MAPTGDLVSRTVAVRTWRVTLAACVTLGALAACTGTKVPQTSLPPEGPSGVAAARTTYPLTIDNCGRRVTFSQAPQRVVLLNGGSVAEVESLIALGVQDRIVANSQRYGISDDPEMVAKIDAIPTGGVKINENFEVPREQVLATSPDLVMSTWAGGFDDKIGSITRDQLAKAGINSYVTPANCALGATDPRPEDQKKYQKRSVESSFELLRELGLIFDVQQRAADLVDEARRQLSALSPPSGPPKRVLVVYPGMATMNTSGMPAVFAGGIYDDIVRRAGGVNVFAGAGDKQLSEINAEALAAANVDVLVIGRYQQDEDAKVMAEKLFSQFPQWPASKQNLYTSVSDSFYLGPLNTIAVKRISDAVRAG